MKKALIVALTVACCALVAAPPAAGQVVTKVGTTSAKFLSIAVGARAVGMGGAFVAVADDPSAMYWNPGGIARLTQSEAVFSHSAWVADMNFNYGGVILPVEGLGTFGINVTSLSMDEMERTTVDQPEGTGQFFSAGSFAVGVTFARNLTDWFSIGGNAKYINEHIWNSGATGLAVDIGTLFTTPFPGLKFGAAITNFGQKMHITGDDLLVQKDISSDNGNNPNINANLATDEFDLPLDLRIGLAYQPIVMDDQSLTLALDATHPNDNAENLDFGGEYMTFHKMIALRAGYKALGAQDSEEQFTLGGGVNYAPDEGILLKFDYAFQKFGRLDNVHKFAVGIKF